MNNTAFLSFLFTYRGELSGFMHNSEVFLAEFCIKPLSESTEQRVFSGFKADRPQLRTDARVARNRVFYENSSLLPEDEAKNPVS